MYSYWFVWSLQICCYHQKEDFEIFKFKSLTILPFFYSTIISLLLVKHGDIVINPAPKKSNQNIFHVVIDDDDDDDELFLWYG